ncbi:hypothetical protein NC99_18240 [Sunxiuqinia dokdonensis]|uniref:Uncharacterized protein n=1 Tax=Sunxiuqinia dokdonensis TaxID=1409788 RepID=A0A0L8VAB0_9BACT|nr:hypothetical protein NC99_18240 [Sunxiuqinia dokdonensis]
MVDWRNFLKKELVWLKVAQNGLWAHLQSIAVKWNIWTNNSVKRLFICYKIGQGTV